MVDSNISVIKKMLKQLKVKDNKHACGLNWISNILISGADQDSVRTSYKRLALKWHPDKHGNSTESMRVSKSCSLFRNIQWLLPGSFQRCGQALVVYHGWFSLENNYSLRTFLVKHQFSPLKWDITIKHTELKL